MMLASSLVKEKLNEFKLRILAEQSNVDDAKAFARRAKRRHMGDFGKQVFFKNALYSVIAERI